MPPPGIIAAPAMTGAGVAAGSSFLTGPVGYGIGSAAGQIAGQSLNKGVNFRGKYARNQLKHDKTVWEAQENQRRSNQTWQSAHDLSQISPNMAAKMKALDESGLHRLAALGISIPSSSSAPGPQGNSNQPMIQGQNNTGSAISEGINTALNVAQSDRQSKQQQVYGNLKLEEQKLRNDWLRIQIQNSARARGAQMANATQGLNLADVTGTSHSGNVIIGKQKPIEHTTDSSGYSLFGPDVIKQRPGTVRGQALEDAVGEIPAALIAPFQFLQDVGYTLDQVINKMKSNQANYTRKMRGKGRTQSNRR